MAKTIEQIKDEIMRKIISDFNSRANDIANGVVNQVMIPITRKYGKEASGRLNRRYHCVVNQVKDGTQFLLVNTATDRHYPNDYYWNVVNGGRRKMPSFSGIRKTKLVADPFRASIETWADSVGFTGNRFWLARNINERGLEGKPELFNEMVNKSKEFIISRV